MSLMCTSTAAKPARSKAAAISTWPLTPCSRRIAIRGRAPVAMNGAAMSSAGSKVSSGVQARDRRSSSDPRRIPGRARGVVAQALQLVRGRRPGAVQLDARLRRAASRRRWRCVMPVARRPARRSTCADEPRGRRSRAATACALAPRAPGSRRPSSSANSAASGSPCRAPSSATVEAAAGRRRPSRTAWRTGRRRSGRGRPAGCPRRRAPGSPRRTRDRRAGSSRSGATSPSWP